MKGVYIVNVDPNNKKPEPTISEEKLLEYMRDIEKYLDVNNKIFRLFKED